MIICDKEKFIFIHIPKNSGSSMTESLQKTYEDTKLLMFCEREGINIGIDKMHLYYEVIDQFIPKNILDKYVKFCIVRNPYDKLYSAWNFIKERHGYNEVNDFVKYKLDENFIYGKEIIPGDARVHYRPQFTFVYDENNNKFSDFIIRYENLNEDISKLNKKYNLNISLYDNGNTQKNYINFFNVESIKKINNLYKKDFILFNYDRISE
jgi:chondroitin 4-sulfotransferase 11